MKIKETFPFPPARMKKKLIETLLIKQSHIYNHDLMMYTQP